MNLYIIICIFLLIIFVPIYLYNFNKNTSIKEFCTEDTDCPINFKCNSSKNKCIQSNLEDCDIDVKNLKKCRIGYNDCQTCINTPQFSCQKISWGKPKIKFQGTNYNLGSAIAILKSDHSKSLNVNIVELTTDTNNGIKSIEIINPSINLDKNSELYILQGKNSDATIVLSENIKYYQYKNGPTTINIPESEDGWCLPSFDQKKSQICNPFTSSYILFKDIYTNNYYWGCSCKYPFFMTHSDDVTSNCTYNTNCKNLYVPSSKKEICTSNSSCGSLQKCCSENGRCLQENEHIESDINNDFYCFNLWNTNSVDDPRQGTCDCGKDLTGVYINKNNYISKSCTQDSCATVAGAYYDSENKRCICPVGYKSCGSSDHNVDIIDEDCSVIKTGITNNGICVPDPCLPNGVFNVNTHKCECNGPSFYDVENKNAYGEHSCKRHCDPDICRGRGTCQYDTSDNSEYCTDCKCPNCNVDGSDPNCIEDTTSKETKLCIGTNGKVGKGSTCYHDTDCCSGHCDGAVLYAMGRCR